MLFACAKKASPPRERPAPTISIEDERTFPQDLQYYAKQAGADKRLLTDAEQAQANTHFLSVFFGSWEMSSGRTKGSEALIRRARGYKLGGSRWTQGEWDEIVDNAGMERFPSMASPAIVVRNTDLREIPTHKPRYDKPIVDGVTYPFDDFQYSLLPIGLPVFVTHVSNDKHWYFVETPIAAGWVVANDIVPVDDAFIAEWKSYPQGALIKDSVSVPTVGTPLNVGTVLPLIAQKKNKVTLLVPVRDRNGRASSAKVSVPANAVARKPLPLTPGNMARIMQELHGQRYGWGGMYGLRDCSATTHDLLVPFGIWLPRNSRNQAKVGHVVSLAGLGHSEKEALIKAVGVPFLSLIGLPGHITMYVGTHAGRVAILHNTWGVRTIEGDNEDARHVIGKTVVTSLTPGYELPNLYRKRSFIDRVRALATPGIR